MYVHIFWKPGFWLDNFFSDNFVQDESSKGDFNQGRARVTNSDLHSLEVLQSKWFMNWMSKKKVGSRKKLILNFVCRPRCVKNRIVWHLLRNKFTGYVVLSWFLLLLMSVFFTSGRWLSPEKGFGALDAADFWRKKGAKHKEKEKKTKENYILKGKK